MDLGATAIMGISMIATGVGSYLAATARANTKMLLEIQHLEDTKASKNGITDAIMDIKLDMRDMKSGIETVEGKVSTLFNLFNDQFSKHER